MTPPLLLYDGTCGLCAAAVQYVLAHERRPTLQFAPLGGATAARLTAQHPTIAGGTSMVLVERDRIFVRSAAALRTARYLGGWRRWLAMPGWLVPRPLRDWAYDVVARHRHALGANACLMPPAPARDRFLD